MAIMVRNIIKASRKTLDKVKEKYCEEECFKFEKFLPMPSRLDFSDGSMTESALLYVIYQKSDEELVELEKKLKINNRNIEYLANYLGRTKVDLVELKQSITVQELHRIEYDVQKYTPWLEEEKLGIKTLEDLGNLCLNNFMDYDAISRRTWCDKNWGACDPAWYYETDKDKLVIDTEWGTPVPIFKMLSKEFPNDTIKVEFADDAGEGAGRLILKNGELIKCKELNYEQAEEIWLCLDDEKSENEIEYEMFDY